MLCFLNRILHCTLGRSKYQRLREATLILLQGGCGVVRVSHEQRVQHPLSLGQSELGSAGAKQRGLPIFQPPGLQDQGAPSPETQGGTCKSGKRKLPELGASSPSSNTASLTSSKWMFLSEPFQMGQLVPRLGRESARPPGSAV